MYADIYKWSTNTSGLGLAEQAAKLITPAQAKKDEYLAEKLEAWEEKCNRMLRDGPEDALADVYKKAAMQNMIRMVMIDDHEGDDNDLDNRGHGDYDDGNGDAESDEDGDE